MAMRLEASSRAVCRVGFVFPVFARIGFIIALVMTLMASPSGSMTALASGEGDMNAAAADAYTKAREAREAGDMEGSLKWLQAAYKSDPQALLLYNIARVLEVLGNYKKAYESYLRLQATPGVSEKLLNLASFQSEELKPKLKEGFVLVSGGPDGGTFYLDGEAQEAVGDEVSTEPGAHTAFIVDKSGAKGWFLKLKLKSGIRQQVALKDKSRKWGALSWAPVQGVSALELDGQMLPVSLETLKLVRVAPGVHKVKAIKDSGPPAELQVMVGAGKKVSIPKRLKGSPTSKVASGAEPVTAEVAATGLKKDPGLWPWVVTGTGAVLLGAGGVLYVSAMSDWDESRDIKQEWKNYNAQRIAGRPGLVRPTSTQREAAELEESGNRDATFGAVMGTLGVAAVGGGIAWWLMTRGDEAAQTAAHKGPSFWIAPAPEGVWTFGARY